jgi:hypothetical protein
MQWGEEREARAVVCTHSRWRSSLAAATTLTATFALAPALPQEQPQRRRRRRQQQRHHRHHHNNNKDNNHNYHATATTNDSSSTNRYKIGKCVGLRSVGAGVKGLVLGSVMFNGLSLVHDYSEHKLGWAMSTCAHDPPGSTESVHGHDHGSSAGGGVEHKPVDAGATAGGGVPADAAIAPHGHVDGEALARSDAGALPSHWSEDVWAKDPLENGPDFLDSRPHVLQNRYFSDGARVLFHFLFLVLFLRLERP